MKCTLPITTLILEPTVKLTWTWKEGRKERTYLMYGCVFFPPSYSQCKCFRENGLQIFILQGVCLKGKLKKVMFIPWLWWLITIGWLDILTWIYALGENLNIYMKYRFLHNGKMIKTTPKSNHFAKCLSKWVLILVFTVFLTERKIADISVFVRIFDLISTCHINSGWNFWCLRYKVLKMLWKQQASSKKKKRWWDLVVLQEAVPPFPLSQDATLIYMWCFQPLRAQGYLWVPSDWEQLMCVFRGLIVTSQYDHVLSGWQTVLTLMCCSLWVVTIVTLLKSSPAHNIRMESNDPLLYNAPIKLHHIWEGQIKSICSRQFKAWNDKFSYFVALFI